MKRFLPLLLLALIACTGKRTSDPTEPSADSLAAARADSLARDSTALPPKAADGLFDDFIYSYMKSPRFQRERTVFPLPHEVDGKQTTIAASDWKHDALYARQDVYTMIFDSSAAMSAEKDTAVHSVVVEWIYLKRQRVKQYVFEKTDGQWQLTALREHALSTHDDADFYEFYNRFATQSAFRKAHIADPFSFVTHDDENFDDMEGVLDRSQWDDFAPALPHGTITNIHYGQATRNPRTRVLAICSQSGGMGSTLTFEKKRGGWMLKKLEN